MMRRHTRRLGSRGAVLVELLIAYIPVLFCFLAFWQLSELLVAQMVVARASSAAGRAAVVVLPDDPMFYAGEAPSTLGGKREADVRLAAGMMLAASPHLAEDFELYIGNLPEDVGAVEVAVSANFRCDRLRFVCGADGVVSLSATSQHTYHGARYQYEPTDVSAAASGDAFASGDASCKDGDPSSNGKGGKGGKGDDGTGGRGNGGGGRGNGSGGTGGRDNDGCPPGQTRQPSGRCESTRSGPGGLCPDGAAPSRRGRCSDGTCQNTGRQPLPGASRNNPCPASNAGGSGGSGGMGAGGNGGSGGVGGRGGAGGAGGAGGTAGSGGASNLPDCSAVEARRQATIVRVRAQMAARWAEIQALFPDDPKPLFIGYRGSLARGRKHAGKGNACWDPEDSDIDFFIAFNVRKNGYRQKIITAAQQRRLDQIAREIATASGIGREGAAHSTFFPKPVSQVNSQNNPDDPQERYP